MIYPLGRPFMLGKNRSKGYLHVSGSKKVRCLVTTMKRFFEMGLQMKHYPSLAKPEEIH